ncbi:unnamed protein product, partial [Urochloa humidicola]
KGLRSVRHKPDYFILKFLQQSMSACDTFLKYCHILVCTLEKSWCLLMLELLKPT